MKFSKSPRINQTLYNMHIFSYRDVVLHLPRRYDDMTPTAETNLQNKQRVVAVGRIVGTPTNSRFSHLCVTKFTFMTESQNILYCEAWNRPYLSKILNSDDTFTLIGMFDAKKNKINLINITKGVVTDGFFLKPIYSLPHDIDNYQYIKLVQKSFGEISKDDIWNEVPAYYMKKYRLIDKIDALKLVHRPRDYREIHEGMRVLKYEECLMFSLKTQLIRNANKELIKNERQHIDIKEVDSFIGKLSYKLTTDQSETVKEILSDMNKQSLMYRLLQGDVGTGKTLVAGIAIYANFLRNDQSAFMAPTDALARQHFKTFCELFKNTDMKIALLLGSTSVKDRSVIRKGLINKEIDLVIGTHALFSKDINYLSLGLAIIDEQHKFGVNQRLLLTSKGEHADLLLMSATPIPRTLALTLYGDLDVSTLSVFPFSSRNIHTQIVKDDSAILRNNISKSLSENKRIFIVAPIIDEGDQDRISVEKLFAKYLLKYPGKVSLLHGKMDDDDKLFALQDFLSGKTPILISTSVIEVGIDVRDADLMLIYEPTHFGLASLHQLRGRIGRDGRPATCLLVYGGDDEEELDKLNVLVNSNDGFFIAEEDLRRRGPGELAGVRQSGIANFTFVNLVDDFRMFELARDDAKFIIANQDQIGFKHIINRANKEIEETKFTNV